MELREVILETLLEARICIWETKNATDGITARDNEQHERVLADLDTMIARLEAMTDDQFARAAKGWLAYAMQHWQDPPQSIK